jgi:hypothetical protein
LLALNLRRRVGRSEGTHLSFFGQLVTTVTLFSLVHPTMHFACPPRFSIYPQYPLSPLNSGHSLCFLLGPCMVKVPFRYAVVLGHIAHSSNPYQVNATDPTSCGKLLCWQIAGNFARRCPGRCRGRASSQSLAITLGGTLSSRTTAIAAAYLALTLPSLGGFPRCRQPLELSKLATTLQQSLLLDFFNPFFNDELRYPSY